MNGNDKFKCMTIESLIENSKTLEYISYVWVIIVKYKVKYNIVKYITIKLNHL